MSRSPLYPQPPSGYVLLDDLERQTARFYEDPVDIITAYKVNDLATAFAKLLSAHADGAYIAGYCAYEMGYALEPKLHNRLAPDRTDPLMQFGVFTTGYRSAPPAMCYTRHRPDLKLKPLWSEAQYLQRFENVIAYIKAGDVYQINLTFPLLGTYGGTADQLYAALRQRQNGRYGGICALGGTDIISFSPELFFKKSGNAMSMRPMKGTRPRGKNAQEDERIRQNMRAEIKSQAENLMIVDLLRNDLSRLSRAGSVKAPELFALETYPTLHQMTSHVTSTLREGVNFEDIFRSLFPCGSVTGAPKIRAMEIIHALEDRPRNAYCGAFGFIDPDGTACFNVGIRTLSLKDKICTYNIGSGIVLDSDGSDEYRECLLKADILRDPPSRLIETFKWTTDTGYIRIEAHLKRLKTSARKLKYRYNHRKLNAALKRAVTGKTTAQRVRLSLGPDGDVDIKLEDFRPLTTPLKLALSSIALTSTLQHTPDKISLRDFYDGERRRLQVINGAQEVIFLNENGELCEGSYTNLFLEIDGQIYTPPVSAGLLPGVLRAQLLAQGKALERSLNLQDLFAAEKIYVGNSLRGLLDAVLVSKTPC